MKWQRIGALLAGVTFAPLAMAELERPVTGSPGSLERVDVIDERCPTFSWGAVERALGYELVVYALPEQSAASADVRPLVARLLPGPLQGWTPSLDDCFETGGEYAWSVRALDDTGAGEWSQVRMFEVGQSWSPSLLDAERALVVLARYVESGESLEELGIEAQGRAIPGREHEVRRSGDAVREHSITAIRRGRQIAFDEPTPARVAATVVAPKALAVPDVVGVRGEILDPSGLTVGLLGDSASSDDGAAGVVGESTATTGATRGVVGAVQSPGAVAGAFDNAAGGQTLSGGSAGTEVFSVDGIGVVRAAAFAGEGSALSAVEAPTLEDQPGSFYRAWGQLTSVPVGFADGIDDDAGGDVTAVRLGAGLGGGGESGDVTLAVDSSQTQARIVASCRPGEAMVAIYADGSIECGLVEASTAITIVDGSPSQVGEYASIVIGADGFPVISYYDATAGALKVVKCNDLFCAGGNETISTVDDSADEVGRWTSIALGADGLPVIGYQDSTNANLKVAKCNDPACAGADETLSVVDGSPDVVGSHVSLAVGADGLPVMAYYDGTALALRVAKCNDPACQGGDESLSFVDDPAGIDTAGQSCSLAVGADGLPVISYRYSTVSTNSLRVAKCNDAACDPAVNGPESLSTVDANNAGWYTSLAVGADGLPIISYYENTAKSLRVAKCNDPGCDPAVNGPESLSIVDDPPSVVGEYNSIAVGGDGLPVISYRDFNAGALKVAKCNDPACTGNDETLTTVDDSAHAIHRQTSITLGADGLPIIAYFDQGAGVLKIARCASASCR